MSGGSFNYLCYKDDEIFNAEATIQEMADYLAKLGYAEDAAQETMETLLEIRQAKIRIETRVNRLKDVWKAVEWCESCDWSEDSIKESLKKYRGVI